MQNNFVKISLAFLVLSFFVSCTAVNKLIPKEKKPFQEKKFDAKLWREGDTQTRGEMSKDLWRSPDPNGDILSHKTREEILEILGEPDRKTRGRCCGAGGTSDGEVWLYELKVKDPSKAKMVTEHLQIYLTPEGKVAETRVWLWDDKNPDYYPRVG